MSDEMILEKVKKFLKFMKEECPECYNKMSKCCESKSSDCCSKD